jgi:hypothetical protein
VRFYGRRYRVTPQTYLNGQDPEYDGRLDGQQALFHDYCPEGSPSLADSVFLHSCPPDDGDNDQLNVLPDGRIVWLRWREIKAAAGATPKEE